MRCARARADAFCSLRARLYPPLWCCALVQDPHDTAGGALSSPNPPRGTRWVTLSASDMYPPLLHTLQFVAIVSPSIAPALLASSTIPSLQFPFAITKRCSVAFLHFWSSDERGLGTVWLLKKKIRSPYGSLDASLYGCSRSCAGRLIRATLFSHALSSRLRSFRTPGLAL